MEKKMSKLYSLEEHAFNIDQYPYCCGIDVACGFTIKSFDPVKEAAAKKADEDLRARHRAGQYWWGNYTPANPKTLPQIHKWYVDQIKKSRAAQIVQAALISKYKVPIDGRTEQVPGLIEYLVKKQWVIQQVFINPAHGNEITIVQKKFRGRNMNNW
jgi:hypothetical protein